jgi:hypothetical protein
MFLWCTKFCLPIISVIVRTQDALLANFELLLSVAQTLSSIGVKNARGEFLLTHKIVGLDRLDPETWACQC